MQGIHELGHVLAALFSSGHVTCVVWHFVAISRTDVVPNPHPLFVSWAGPLLGSTLPWVVHRVFLKHSLPLKFFAGFCLVANGTYVSVGSIDRIGDAGVLLKLGSAEWFLWAVGSIAVIGGLGIWHTMGSFRQLRSWSVTGFELTLQLGLLLPTVAVQVFLFSS